MASEKREPFRDPLEMMVRDILFPIPEEAFPEGVPLTVKRHLWDYALGIASAEEEAEVHRWLAISPQVQEEMARIVQAMKDAQMPLAIQLEEAEQMPLALRSVWEEVEKWLMNVPGLFRSLAVVLVDTVEGLLWSQQGPGIPWDLRASGEVFAPSPVMMDVAKPPEFPPRLQVHGRHGVTVIVDRIAHGNLHLKVSVAGPASGETVRLLELIRTPQGVEQRPFGDTVPLQEGKAEFPECPPGLWKIVVSDGRELCLFIAQGEEAPKRA